MSAVLEYRDNAEAFNTGEIKKPGSESQGHYAVGSNIFLNLIVYVAAVLLSCKDSVTDFYDEREERNRPFCLYIHSGALKHTFLSQSLSAKLYKALTFLLPNRWSQHKGHDFSQHFLDQVGAPVIPILWPAAIQHFHPRNRARHLPEILP